MNKISNKIKKEILINLSIVAIVMIYFIIIPMSSLENYPNWLLFTIILLITGFVIGILIYKIITFYFPSFKYYRINKKSNPVGLSHITILLSIMLIFSLGIFLNNYIVINSEYKKYSIDRVSISKNRRRSYLFIINEKNKKERLQFGREFLKSIQYKKEIRLYKNTGFLGFNFYKHSK